MASATAHPADGRLVGASGGVGGGGDFGLNMNLGAVGGSDLLQTQDLICELQDELRVMEGRVADREGQIEQIIQRNTQREKALLECLEGLTGYVTMVEQNVLMPALGNLLLELSQHHKETADARQRGVARVTRVVGGNTGSRLGRLLSHLSSPSPNVVAAEERRQARERLESGAVGAADAVCQPEDAYLLATALQQDKHQMQQLVKFCLQQLEAGGAVEAAAAAAVSGEDRSGSGEGGVGSERQRRVIDRQNKEIAMLQQQSDSLKSEVQRLHATSQHGADTAASVQEKAALAAQLQSLEATFRQERAILNSKIDSLQNSLAQTSSERDAARLRADQLDREAAQTHHEKHVMQQQGASMDGAVQALQHEKSLLSRKLEQVRCVLPPPPHNNIHTPRPRRRHCFSSKSAPSSDRSSRRSARRSATGRVKSWYTESCAAPKPHNNHNQVLMQELDQLRDRGLAGAPDHGDVTVRDALQRVCTARRPHAAVFFFFFCAAPSHLFLRHTGAHGDASAAA